MSVLQNNYLIKIYNSIINSNSNLILCLAERKEKEGGKKFEI